MLLHKDEYIASAYDRFQVISSQDKEKRLEYEARQKAIWDYNQMMLEAEQRGLERGIEQGEKQITRINKLHALLVQDERYDDLKRSTSDKDFRQQLIEQYGI